MSWAIAVGASITAVSSFDKSQQNKKAAKDLRKQTGPSNQLLFNLLNTRSNAASALERMAKQLESGEPLTESERTFLASVQTQANRDIEDSRRDTLSKNLGTAAGTGFLRAGRTQEQSRRTNIEAEGDRNKAAIAREQKSLDRAFRRTVELPAQLRTAILTGAQGPAQTFIPKQSNGVAEAAGSIGVGLIGFGSQQSASNTQADAIRALSAQIGTGQGSTTAGGTSVSGTQSDQSLQNLVKQLEMQQGGSKVV